MFHHNNKTYLDSDPVDYEVAIEIDDYYKDAMSKGLPNPPACLVFGRLRENSLQLDGSAITGFASMMGWLVQRHEKCVRHDLGFTA